MKSVRHAVGKCLVLLCLSQSLSANDQAPLIDFKSPFIPEMGVKGMVTGPEPLASQAGLHILKQGGNAIDAAVATGFALAVTLPRAGNLGGGGFMLVHLAEQNKQVFIDYREVAPAAATRDMFLQEDGTVDRAKAFFSHQSAGVPGTPAGLLHALEQYGTLDLATVIEPAIRLAEDGFPMTPTLNLTINARADRLAKNPEARRIFLANGDTAPPVGTLFKQPELAATLKRIRDNGHKGFYQGKTAELIAADMRANKGLITLDDLADYRALEREPVRGTFKDYEVVSAPPPSSGGVHVLQILQLMEGYPLQALGHNSAAYLHRLIESMKLAYADRSKHMGDPSQSTIPTQQLITKAYADERRQLINEERATPSTELAPGMIVPDGSTNTTHYSVADTKGNVVTNTYTLNFSFGSHIVVPGTGMLLNNEMDDFAARPGFANAYGLVQGEANAIAPGRRPLSSMTPTLVFKEGKPWLATGSPGGSVIITAVAQLLLNVMAFDMNIATAAAAPRVHHQWHPDKTRIEKSISPDTLRLLEEMGHTLEVSNWTLGRTNSIMIDNGWFYGYSDLRRPGGFVATE
jgi:gamma-glutamyltranspeptidase/glutathione hydrolase